MFLRVEWYYSSFACFNCYLNGQPPKYNTYYFNLRYEILTSSSLLFICLFDLVFLSHAQYGFKIKSYDVGYRIYQIDAIGTNPTAISPLLKNPQPYMHFLNNLRYNSLYGEPGPQTVHDLYFNVELNKNASSGFWKKHTIQAGLFITKKMTKGAGAMENLYSKDTVNYSDRYSEKYVLTQNMQFAGINLGLTRRIKVARRLQTIIGIQGQGGFAFVHNYQPYWDSSFRVSADPWQTKSVTYLPALKGKNFFQWQVMLPLGLEYQIYKDKFFVRLEVEPGIVGNRYIYNSFAAREAHGAGIWIIYCP